MIYELHSPSPHRPFRQEIPGLRQTVSSPGLPNSAITMNPTPKPKDSLPARTPLTMEEIETLRYEFLGTCLISLTAASTTLPPPSPSLPWKSM